MSYVFNFYTNASYFYVWLVDLRSLFLVRFSVWICHHKLCRPNPHNKSVVTTNFWHNGWTLRTISHPTDSALTYPWDLPGWQRTIMLPLVIRRVVAVFHTQQISMHLRRVVWTTFSGRSQTRKTETWQWRAVQECGVCIVVELTMKSLLFIVGIALNKW